MATEITNVPGESRYEISIDGERVGFAEYRIAGDSIVFTHTQVDGDRREKGLASSLVQTALDDVRNGSERRVVAQCPYVAHWIDTHSEYGDLLRR